MIKVLVFPTTYICDERCIMCTIPGRESTDLPVDFFERFFSDENLSTLQSINLTGGEPTLRKDLDKIVQMIMRHCHQLKEIIINSNGSNPNRVISRVTDVLKVLDSKVKLWVNISLDALDDKTSDFIRGRKNTATNAKNSLLGLKKLSTNHSNLEVGINTTITSQNYNKLRDIFEFAIMNDYFLDFSYATVNTAYINSAPLAHKFVMNQEQKNEVIEFLKSISYEKIGSTKHYFNKLIERLEGVKGNRECVFFDREGVLLEADGKVRVCGMTEDSYLGDLNSESTKDILNKCTPDLSKNCSVCETNSYFNWTKTAQEKISQDMFDSIKLLRS
ncbi:MULTISPECIES: radical SAM protein [unclassified Sutcliffiella]|uniref:radical SAM protein n=1 Tax=unclassified Sutcliffiella TaxID=2837532 RepID=UPI0030D60750